LSWKRKAKSRKDKGFELPALSFLLRK